MSLQHGYVNSGESTPQESATDKAKVHELHFMSASEADFRPKMKPDPENVTEAELHFTAYGHADSRPKIGMGGIYNTPVSETETGLGGQGLGVSQGENETRTEPASGSGTAVEPPNGSTEDGHACPSEPTDTGQSQPTPPPTTLTCETKTSSAYETRPPEEAADDDFPVWAIWTIEMPHTRKDGACPFSDCPYHKTPREKNPDSWSWLL
jgi:hypothetical protein